MLVATLIFFSFIFKNQAIAKTPSTPLPENQLQTLETWCFEVGGKWLEKSCEWHQLNMDINQEQRLERECSDRSGIWQTITEDIVGPSICGNGICTSDAVIIGAQEKGVGCVWYSDIK